MSGKLYIIATPIGNLGDISKRQKECLSIVDLVLAEDTRVTLRLLNFLSLKKPLRSCHDFNESGRLELLAEMSRRDEAVALVCDAGTPLVSDPGYQIVRKAIELKMQIIPVPGPSAAITALTGSGLPCDRFSFEGFLPEKAGEREKRLAEIKNDDRTLIFFLAPSNMLAIVNELREALGDRPACLARELTKVHEEFIRDSLSGIIDCLTSRELKGEFVLLVGGNTGQTQRRADESQVRARLLELLKDGGRLKDISSLLAKESGWSASEVYKIGLGLKESEEGKP